MRFLAIEHELPTRRVTNDEVLENLREQSRPHLDDGQLDLLVAMTQACFASTGTSVRYHRAEGEEACELARRAGLRALESSGLRPADIDLLLYVGIGRGVVEPASATIYQDLLGLDNATCFDIVDACASWLRALHVAEHFLRAGVYRNIMILNAEFVGRDCHRYALKELAEFAHWHPSVTIGEAATATILTGDPKRESDFSVDFRTWGSRRDLCFVPLSNFEGYFGKAVNVTPEPMRFISFGLRLMEFGSAKLIEHYRSLETLRNYDPDVILGHSASDGMARYIVTECGLDTKRFAFTHKEFANTISASVPLAMSWSAKRGGLNNGDDVLVLMASAGVTTAVAKFKYVC